MQSCALLLPSIDVPQDLVHLCLVHLGALLCVVQERVADHACLGALCEPVGHLVMQGGVHVQARASTAVLALVVEQRLMRHLDGLPQSFRELRCTGVLQLCGAP